MPGEPTAEKDCLYSRGRLQKKVGSIEAEPFILADAGVPDAIRENCCGCDRMTQVSSPGNAREKEK